MPTLVERIPSTANSGIMPRRDRGENESEQVEPSAEQVGRARHDVPDEPAQTDRVFGRCPDLLQHRSDGETQRARDGDQCSEHVVPYTKICAGGGKPLKFEA